MRALKENPKLKDFQAYVADMVKQRGFNEDGVAETFMGFLEECGEMAQAARKTGRDHTRVPRLDHEIADVFIYLLDICNRFEVDLEKAFREKEEINKKRTWPRVRK